jgi:hypothetical protein
LAWEVLAFVAVGNRRDGRRLLPRPITSLQRGLQRPCNHPIDDAHMTSSNSAVDRLLAAVEAGRMETCDAYEGDAVLDATVPNWRFTVRGAEAIRAEYSRWFADPAAFTSLRRLPTACGEVVEYTLSWTEADVAHEAHHVHVLEVDGDRIVRDTVMCGGRWAEPLLAQMAPARG